MKGTTMNYDKIHELFRAYNFVAGQLALLKVEIEQSDSYLTTLRLMDLEADLYNQRFDIRRKLNSAYRDLEQSKPLWKRIFKK